MPPRAAPSHGQPPASGNRGRGGSQRGGASRGGGAPQHRGGSAARRARAPHSGTAPKQTTGPSAVPEHITTVGVRRPDYGTAGRRIGIVVNAFPVVNNTEETFYHYDAIQPETLPLNLNLKLIEQLQGMHPDIFNPRAVYDNRKNMYAVSRLLPLGPTDSREFDVPDPDAGDSRRRPPRMYKVKLTRVKIDEDARESQINSAVLQRFVEQQQSLSNEALTAIQVLNVAIRMEPIRKYPFNDRSFFTPQGRRDIGGGIELWRGYFQSIRPTIGRLIVNVDISSCMMYKSGSLINLCLDFLGRGNNPNLLSPVMGFQNPERLRLQSFIKGLKIQINTGGGRPRIIRTVRGLSMLGADRITFMHDGVQTNVARYFFETLNQAVCYPTMICVDVGRGAMYPLEFCTVPQGQISRCQIPPDMTKDFVEFSTLKPVERFRSIQEGVQLLAYGQSEYVRQFGLTIDTSQFINLNARVLNPPRLQYGLESTERIIVPRNGSWNMADKKFYLPTTIRNWVILIYDMQFVDGSVRKFINDFIHACGTVGMTVEGTGPIVRRENGQGNISRQIKDAIYECVKKKKVEPNLVVVILPEGGNDIYRKVKYAGDITIGVATQCLKALKVKEANLQFWANVLLKVNVKLGGINLIPDPASVHALTDPNTPTIVMGADVMHPPPRSENIPSYAALVTSVDSKASKYIATTEVQASGVEQIRGLEKMCKFALEKCIEYRRTKENTTAPLKRLIFYRDGVSESQFKDVLDNELEKIQDACKDLNIQPKITLIIVGKRHHIRFQTQRAEDQDRSGNAPAGTIVDQGIGHPVLFDFYLQSHGGLKGTSRSSHYSVLHDDNGFNSDTLQQLSFALCHLYARSTRSVSIPAPVYYADIVCSRAKFHYDPAHLPETMSQSSGAEAYVDQFMPLNAKQVDNMYFM